MLLAADASVHVENTRGETALGEAVRGGHEEVVELLRTARPAPEDIPLERPSPELEPAPRPVPPAGRR
jgi:hypothetical protein